MRISTIVMVTLFLLSGSVALAEETDQHGVAHAWKGSSTRYTVVDFAAAWCRPCWGVLPRLEAFALGHPGIRVVVVSVDDNVKGRDALVAKLNLTLPVVWDENHRIAEHYRPEGMPATFVLDPNGEIVYRHAGSAKQQWDEMVAFLEKATKH